MKENELFVRITAGQFKGKKIILPSKGTTRSTKSIVKSSFFDTVQYEIVGDFFVEVFGGSGSVGLEAASRGAKHAYFIEQDRDSFRVLQGNINAIAPLVSTAIAGDSFEQLSLLASRLQKEGTAGYFYIDPPFSIREGMGDVYEKTVAMIESLPIEIIKLIVIEHDSGVSFPENIGTLQQQKVRKFGRTSLSYYA